MESKIQQDKRNLFNLYKSRKYSTVKLDDGKSYKIPNEYTVQEVERLLELRIEQEALETEEVLNKELNRWIELAEKNAPLVEKLEYAQIKKYLDEAIKLKEITKSSSLR